MQYLVRKEVSSSQSEFEDLDYDAKELSFGSDDRCLVSLGLPAGCQLVIRKTGDGKASYRADKGLSVSCNDEASSKGSLSLGDTLVVEGYELSLVAAPMGFDLAIQVQSSGALTAAKPRFATDLAQSAISVRVIGYIALALILVFFLVLPTVGLFDEDVSKSLRDLPIPSDNSWSSGPLIPAHRIPEIGDNCQTCHVQPFQMVQDQQCLACHRDLKDHINLDVHKVHEFAEFRCASCHRDHNEPAQIVRTDDGLCVDCHAEIDRFDIKSVADADVRSKPVTGFADGAHPAFRYSMLTPKGKGGSMGWEIERPSLPHSELVEKSNLKFPHDLHLDPEKVQLQNSGEPMQCNNCHQLQDDGEHFAPVSMDKDCRSCHSLTFDVFDPDIELPHGDQRSAIVAMEAHFIREFTDPVLREQRAATKPRRVPGKREGRAACQGTGLDCGRAEALKEAEYQFANTGCVTCHVVVDTGASDISDRWYIQPIKISNDWYTRSDFDHQSHLALAGENERAVCESCHAVADSSLATDISIPEIGNCLQCHDTSTHDTVALDCVGCHGYHYPDGSAMTAKKAGASTP
ncbi:MAG: cytochrome c3 family protein [Pseudomonadales bacterium]